MRRSIAYPYLLLGLLLFCWIHLPRGVSDRLRYFTVASFSPVLTVSQKSRTDSKSSAPQIARLEIENRNLRSQIESALEWVQQEVRIEEQTALLKGLLQEQSKASDPHWREFFQRRAQQLRNRLQRQLAAFPARVIYRDPSSWSSSLWINAGEEDNRAVGQSIIAKNSPVVAGGALVGVIDFVGEKQSRVRLITDSGLSPAVRAVRGGLQNRELSQQVEGLRDRLKNRGDLFSSEEEKTAILDQLGSIQKKIGFSWEDGYLAKGEVHGSSAPFWRARNPILKGIGFNFDYPDEEGGSRDLKTGRPVGTSAAAIPILKEGDLLVTSGLDGVFPVGFLVGTVSQVKTLKEGGYAYEIEARPAINCLNDLQTLFILPPLIVE